MLLVPEIQRILRQFQEDTEENEEDLLHLLGRHEDLQMGLTLLIEMVSVEFLLGEVPNRIAPVEPNTCTEALLRNLDPQLIQQVPHPTLLPRFRQPIFVHLYSGRRRAGDLQAQLEQLDWTPDLVPLVVSLDVMVDKGSCDMMDERQRSFWLRKAYEGAIDGGWAGPPCETWSSARHHPLNTPSQPRPLRHANNLWGLEGLDIREQAQVFVGNTLLCFAVLFQFIMWMKGRWMGLEHPKEPENADYPSIWRLPFIKLMLQLPGMRKLLVQQGHYEGKSPKPTHLMFAHSTDELDSLAISCRTSRLPPPVKMGRSNKPGEYYNTAELKEYPAQFCKFLALAFADWAKARPVEPFASELPSDVFEQFLALHVDLTKSREIFGPDYAGEAGY